MLIIKRNIQICAILILPKFYSNNVLDVYGMSSVFPMDSNFVQLEKTC